VTKGAGPSPRPPVSLTGWARIALRSIAMVLMLIVGIPFYHLWRPFTRHNPWPRYFLSTIAKIIGLRIDVKSEPRRHGSFILANHVSWLDIPALTSVTGTAFVAHDGLTVHGWLHWLASLNDTVFIARHDRKSVARQVEQVREAVRETGSLAIFPEGTTADGQELLPFKSSLLSAITPVPDGIVVQPVLIDYGDDAGDIAWIGDEPGLDNFLRIAARSRSIRVTIHFLQPLGGDDLANRKTIATAAREAIGRALETKDSNP